MDQRVKMKQGIHVNFINESMGVLHVALSLASATALLQGHRLHNTNTGTRTKTIYSGSHISGGSVRVRAIDFWSLVLIKFHACVKINVNMREKACTDIKGWKARKCTKISSKMPVAHTLTRRHYITCKWTLTFLCAQSTFPATIRGKVIEPG